MELIFLALLASLALARGLRKKPLVSPEDFPSLIELPDLLYDAQQLEDFAYAYPERNRVFGGHAHLDTVNHIYDGLAKTGYYDVYKQRQIRLWARLDQSLTVNSKPYDSKAMVYSPSVNVTAKIELLSNFGCDASDYPADLSGKIALIQRGNCSFADKSVRSAAAGAVAVIIFNNVEGPFGGTLGGATSESGPYSPIIGISFLDGHDLISRIDTERLMVSLWIDGETQNRTTCNVIAQTKGGDPNNVIALGGHTDSVHAGPGINDDGSGTISNLVIAKALTRFSVKNAVRFLFWTAEEFGTLGSTYYVANLNATELSKVRLYLNFDMIASPNYALMIYDESAQIRHLFEDYYRSVNRPFVLTKFNGRSDYHAFVLNGIPSGGLCTGAEEIKTEEQARLFGGQAGVALDPNYHTSKDNMTNLNHQAFLINSKAAAFAVATYANHLESIPLRNATAKSTAHSHAGGTECLYAPVE